MKYANLFFCLLVTFLTAFSPATAQQDDAEGYYLFPIKPGQRNSLSGTMGELRSNHFHAGLDIRTDGRIGLPVYAAADGYVSRISVSAGGYGNALYLQHPNGTTTVYAHLDRFTGGHGDFLRGAQYKQKTFDINLYLNASDFPVKKGDIIAYSGNSGSSGGPHVHFDLRDSKQDLLNPLSYGFPEIVDKTPPVAVKLAIKTMTGDARVEGRFGRLEYPLKKSGNNYVIEKPVQAVGKIGLELYGYDLLDNSGFRCGIKVITVEAGDKEIFQQDISTFAFSEQRNILRHMDYQALKSSGERFHKLYIDDGNFLRFYKTDRRQGKIVISENQSVPVKISMEDTYGNISTISFTLEGKSLQGALAASLKGTPDIELIDNFLKIHIAYPASDTVAPVGIRASAEQLLAPSYIAGGKEAVYLWDMRVAIPKVLRIGETLHELPYKAAIPPKGIQRYSDDYMTLNFPSYALFDTLYITTAYEIEKSTGREIFSIGDPHIPLRKNINIILKPQQAYENPTKVAAYEMTGAQSTSHVGGEWVGDAFSFSTRDFGRYTLLEDVEKPQITPLTLNGNDLKFRISDALSGISEFNCYVNGEWILMNYDYKQNLIWSEKKHSSTKFTGEVKLVVTDNVNNQNIYITKLN